MSPPNIPDGKVYSFTFTQPGWHYWRSTNGVKGLIQVTKNGKGSVVGLIGTGIRAIDNMNKEFTVLAAWNSARPNVRVHHWGIIGRCVARLPLNRPGVTAQIYFRWAAPHTDIRLPATRIVNELLCSFRIFLRESPSAIPHILYALPHHLTHNDQIWQDKQWGKGTILRERFYGSITPHSQWETSGTTAKHPLAVWGPEGGPCLRRRPLPPPRYPD